MKTNPLLILIATAGFILAPPALPVARAQDSLRVDTSGNPVSTLNLGSPKLIGTLSPARLGTGTPTSGTVLRGDGTWAATTPTGSTIASTGSLLMGDGAGNAVAVANGADLFRVLKTRRETASATETPPVNLLPQAASFNGSATLPTGNITIPANSTAQWYLPGQGSTYAGQSLYSYAVAVGDAPYGALLLKPVPGGGSYVGTNTTLAPGVYRGVSVLPAGNGDLYFQIINTTGAPITIYPPVLATADTGLVALSSYADQTAVSSQPVANFDFTKFESADRTGRYLAEKQTTIVADSVSGHDTSSGAGTLYNPKKTLSIATGMPPVSGPLPLVINTGDFFGLYRGSLFRDSLSISTQAVTQGVVVADVGLGRPGNLPVISAFDTVPSGSWTSNGDGTYSALWTPANNPLDTGDQGKPFVVEINTSVETTTPLAARKSLAVLSSQSAVASTPGSCFILPPGTGSGQSGSGTQYKAVIHPSGTFASFRYEVVSRSWGANWKAGNLGNGDDGSMSGVSVFNGSNGYGMTGSQSFVADRMIFSHASLHHAVFGSGSLQRSVFYEMGVDNTDNSGGNSAIQFVWYTHDGTGLSFDTRRCLFYSINGNYPSAFLAHTDGNNYARGDVSDCAFTAGRIADGSLRGVAIQYNNVASGTINRVYVQGYQDAIELNVQPIDVKNSVFRQVKQVQVASTFHDNVVAAESASVPGSYGNSAAAIVLAATGASATNNILWAHGLASGVPSDASAYGITIAGGVTAATSQRNIIVFDPDPSFTDFSRIQFPGGSTPSAFSFDYNLYINTGKGGFGSGGGSGNYNSWTAYQAAYPTLDAHSMFVDLSNDPRGLKAVFADPANGDFRWAQTDVARRCAAFCKANNVGPAAVTSRWPVVPTVDEAARLITGL